jgi:predicted anti-sigma-YlaC factor YlaD
VLLLEDKLELDDKLEVLEHLDRCPICRDAVYQIARDRDEALFIPQPPRAEKIVA